VTYDYVIVGAGSAGCVLAYRLTADPSVRVLLVEAGGRDTNPLIHIPIGLGKLWEHRMFDWGYDTEPEPRLDNRRIEAMRGKVLGGSSSINVMAYVRGHRGDYDRWAQRGCRGWSYAEVLPYFKRCESWEKGEDAWRGGHGPLSVIDSRNRDPLFDGWLDAAREAGRLACAGHNLAFDPVVLRLRSLVAEGELGEVVHVDAMQGYNLAGPFGAIAMSEPGTGSDLQGVRTSARKSGNGYVLNGSKTFITNGQHANLVIVVAKTDPAQGAKGVSLMVVETENAPGFRRGRKLKKLGLEQFTLTPEQSAAFIAAPVTATAARMRVTSAGSFRARTARIRSSAGTSSAAGARRWAIRSNPGDRASTPIRVAVAKPGMAASAPARIAPFHVTP